MKYFKNLLLLILILGINTIIAQTSFNISNKTTGDTLLTIDNDGNVGIGTTNPVTKLEVLSTDPDQNSTFRLGNSDLSNYLRFSSGRTTYPNPFIMWNAGSDLRFGTAFSEEYMRLTGNGNLGIGTTTPTEMLEVADTIYSSIGGFKFPDGSVQATSAFGGDNGFLSTGTFGTGSIPIEGAGTRLMWYPAKAAFRVGQVLGTNWNDTQIGNHSIGIGYNNIASGQYSVALGGNNTASATVATALGGSNTASGLASTAIGNATEASGAYSTAMGAGTIASGVYSMAIGQEIEALGSHSIAIALSDQDGLQVTQDTTMAIMGGRVGIGTTAPNTRLEVADTIYSSIGGFKFPDGTVQETAAGEGGVISIDNLSDGISTPSSVYLGSGAGTNDIGDEIWCTAVGIDALNSNTSAYGNSAFGFQSLDNNTGTLNTGIGAVSLGSNSGGNRNTALGYNALGSNTIGSNNVGIGNSANFFNEQGNQNTIIGYQAGYGTGTHNKDGNIFIGYQAGYNEHSNNKLYIENSNSSTPLIGGDFSTDEIYLSGKVGIDTTAPAAELHVAGTDGALFSGTLGNGTIPAEGAGVRMMWYPAKAALRFGELSGGGSIYWDADSIGDHSFAAGINTKATGDRAVAFGSSAFAEGNNAVALGDMAFATGPYSRAIGSSVTASGGSSMAMGLYTYAEGDYSTALGYRVRASGEGSFVIGDHSSLIPTHEFSYPNRFTARFAGGYYFYSGSTLSNGVRVIPGGNSWSSLSDSTKKENFRPVDGESFLKNISRFKLTSWNFKGQDPTQFRHYGPMAQDFYAAFGHDGIGTIGNDTTIASADFDGVNLIAIQALEKRTTQLKEKINEISDLKKDNQQLKEEIFLLKSKIEKFESLFSKVEELTIHNKKQFAKNENNSK